MSDLFMHHDARGERGPYTAIHAEGPWFCMAPEGVKPPPEMLRSGGMLAAKQVLEQHGDLMRRVGWASDRSLRAGLDQRGVGWVPVS